MTRQISVRQQNKRKGGKGERTGSDSGRMKTSERDQLNQESFFAEIPDEGFELFRGESMGPPIERRGQIVNEPPETTEISSALFGKDEVREAGSLVWVLLADRASERLSLFEIGSFRFEPKEVGNIRESESPLQRSLQDQHAHQN